MQNEANGNASRRIQVLQAAGERGGRNSSPWPAFQRRLAEALGALEEDQYLVVSRKRGWGYVQFAAQGAHGMRAECVSNNYLDASHALSASQVAALGRVGWSEPTRANEGAREKRESGGSSNFYRDFEKPVPLGKVARMAVRTLSEVLEIPHPGYLQYKAFRSEGGVILLPTLGLKREPPPTPPEPPAGGTADEARKTVLEALRKSSGNVELEFAKNGELSLRFGRALVIVLVLEDPLCVRMYAPVLEKVEAGDELVGRLNDMNANVRFARLFLLEGTVYAAVEVPARPLVEAHVTRACEGLGRFADETGVELEQEFGGRMPFDRAPDEAVVQ